MSEKMLWDKEYKACVKASKLREIRIYPNRVSPIDRNKIHTEVMGWFNSNEYFDFGSFDTEQEAETFVIQINKQIES